MFNQGYQEFSDPYQNQYDPNAQIQPVAAASLTGDDLAKAKRNTILEGVFSAIIHIVIGVLFYIYSTNSTKYGGSTCVKLRTAAYYYSIFCFVEAGLRLIVFTPASYSLFQGNSHPCMEHIVDFLRIFETICSIAFLIALAYAYNLKEGCDSLAKLTFIYLIIVAVLIGLVVLLICCFCCIALNSQQTTENTVIINNAGPNNNYQDFNQNQGYNNDFNQGYEVPRHHKRQQF